MPVTPRKPRLKRVEQKENRTKEILDAAWELFCELGYDSITIDQIGEAAGYSRKPVYTLFGDKQSLFFELWLHRNASLTDLAVSLFDPSRSLRANLRELAEVAAKRSGLSETYAGEGLYIVMQTIALGRPDLAARAVEASAEVMQRVTKAIKNCKLEKGERLRGSAELVAAHLIAHINGLSMLRFQAGKNFMKAQDLYELFSFMAIQSTSERKN
jgi:AcrR family transcriptional regulator